jgi:hypothetical protein
MLSGTALPRDLEKNAGFAPMPAGSATVRLSVAGKQAAPSVPRVNLRKRVARWLTGTR